MTQIIQFAINDNGHIFVSKELQQILGLLPGMKLIVEEEAENLVLRPELESLSENVNTSHRLFANRTIDEEALAQMLQEREERMAELERQEQMSNEEGTTLEVDILEFIRQGREDRINNFLDHLKK